MRATTAAKKAVEEMRKWMSRSESDERQTLEAFDEAFAAEVEGWRMRMEELEEDDD